MSSWSVEGKQAQRTEKGGKIKSEGKEVHILVRCLSFSKGFPRDYSKGPFLLPWLQPCLWGPGWQGKDPEPSADSKKELLHWACFFSPRLLPFSSYSLQRWESRPGLYLVLQALKPKSKSPK